MRNRIEASMKVGQISEEIRKQHKGFGDWDLVSDRRNHQTILQVLLIVFYSLQPYPLIVQYTKSILFVIRCRSLVNYRQRYSEEPQDVPVTSMNCLSCLQRFLC